MHLSTGGQPVLTLTPKSTDTSAHGLSINQDNDVYSIYIDSEATTQAGIKINMANEDYDSILTNSQIKVETADYTNTIGNGFYSYNTSGSEVTHLQMGRNSGEAFELTFTDTSVNLINKNDSDENGDHFMNFDIDTTSTGDDIWEFRSDGTNRMVLNSSEGLQVNVGSITLDNGGLTNNDLNLNGSTHSTLRSTATDKFQVIHGGTNALEIDSLGDVTFSGDIAADNLSGTNTGDQDLSGYVPYTGATTNVNLGEGNSLVAQNLYSYDSDGSSVIKAKTNLSTGYAGMTATPNDSETQGIAFISYGSAFPGTVMGQDKAGLNRWYTYGGDAVLGTFGSYNLYLGTNDTLAMTIDTDQDVTFEGDISANNLSGTNTGDQDLSGYALKSNVLELDNTSAFTPDADYEPATKKYVDDQIVAGGIDLGVESQIPYMNSTDDDFDYGGLTYDGTKIEISNASAELRLNDTTSGDYARLKRVPASNGLYLYNTVEVPAGGGQAIVLNGSTSYVNLGDFQDWDDVGTGNFTINAWVKTTNSTTTVMRIFESYNSLAPYTGVTLHYRGSDDRILGWTKNVPGSTLSSTATNINDGNWHNIQFKRTASTTLELWVDGSKVASTSSATNDDIAQDTLNANIGRSQAFGGYWDGEIDEMALWSRGLTDDETADLYNSGVGYYIDEANNFPSTGTSIADNIIAIFHFDGDLVDSSSNNNDGSGTAITYDNGIVSLTGSDEEVRVIKSVDGISGGQKGVTTFGQAEGRSILVGDKVELQVNDVTTLSVENNENDEPSIKLAFGAGNPIIIGDISGNSRGTNALDFQTVRASADQVAATDDSTIIGSNNKTGNGTGQTILGSGNEVYGRFSSMNDVSKSVAVGSDNTIGQSGTSVGGYNSCILGVGNQVQTLAGSSSSAFIVGLDNVTQGGSFILGKDNIGGDGSGMFVVGQNSDSYGGAANVLIGQNNTSSSNQSVTIGKNNTASGVTNYCIGGYNDSIGSDGIILGISNELGHSPRTCSLSGNSNTLTITGDVTSEFSIGDQVIVYGTQDGMLKQTRRYITGVSYSSPNTTLTASSVYFTSSSAISSAKVANITVGEDSLIVGQDNTNIGTGSMTIGYNIDTSDDDVIEMGLDDSTKMQYDSNGNLKIYGDFETLGGSSKGIILESPDTTKWRITVDNTGTLQVASV